MDEFNLMNIDIKRLKKIVSDKLGIPERDLEIELEKIKAETGGLAGDRTALLLLLERWGIRDRDLVEEIVIGDSITPIGELGGGTRIATVLGRIMRILPDKESRQGGFFGRVLLQDSSGRAILYLFGKSYKDFKKYGFDLGEVILVKRARVRRAVGGYIILTADDDSVIERPKEERFSKIIRNLPEPPVVLSIYEFLDTLEIFSEGEEVNVEGVVDYKSDLRVFERKDAKEGLVINLTLTDINVPGKSIRVVAWDDLASFIDKNIMLGQIVKIFGSRVKLGYDQQGNIRYELHLGKLSTITIAGEKRAKVGDLHRREEDRVVLYGVVVDEPIVREFERGNEVKKYAYFTMADDTGSIRVVLWEIGSGEGLLDKVKKGALLRVYGRLVSNGDRVELHVQREKNITVLPDDYELDFDKDIILSEIEGSYALQSITISNFNEVPEEGFVNITGRIAMISVPENDRLPGQLIVEDENGNAIKVISWDREIFDKLYGFGMGAKVRATDLRVSVDRVSGEKILKATRRTEIEKLEEFTQRPGIVEDFMDAKSILERRQIKKLPFLREADLSLGESKFIASIILINRAGRKKFCSQCGAPLIDNQEVCENGHMDKGEELLYVDAVIDDGQKSFEALISTKAVGLDGEKEFLDYLEEILGLDVVFEAEPKVRRDGTVYLVIKRIELLDYTEIVKNYIDKEA